MFRQRMGDGRVRRFEGTCWQVDTVCLWLGANVMMEFTFDEVSRSASEPLKSIEVALERPCRIRRKFFSPLLVHGA
jgi:hypothetical protein